MAKMTISGLQTAMATYVAAAKQANTWTASTNNFLGALDKIGKQVTIDGLFNDKLPELEGDNLPLGTTIEEYFVDLVLPEAWTSVSVDGALDETPSLPSVENCAYSYTLGREKIKTTVPYDNIERAMLSESEAANALTKISVRLQNSYDLTRYAEKKQLMANAIVKANTAGLSEVLAVPVDTATGEAFIKKIKTLVEATQFAHQGDCLAGSGALIGATPESNLVLYIKKGVIPSLEVDTLSGCFQVEKLAMPCRVKVVDDFGSADSKFYAILCDDRGIKLHNHYNATRSKENAEGDFINYVRHFEDTGFISKFTYMHVIKSAN